MSGRRNQADGAGKFTPLNFSGPLTTNLFGPSLGLIMRKIFVGSLAALALSCAFADIALADADPTVHQIYEAASSGRLDQAQQLMDQVLRDHPNSSKAHYVQSELYAREGKPALARAELARAEQLSPGLPNENPRSVAELKTALGTLPRTERAFAPGAPSAAHFPWSPVLILALAVGVFFMLFRRRTTYGPAAAGGVPPGAPGTYGPSAPVAGGGLGSAVAGGLAGGLAVGAGVVAGEALAHRLLDGDRSGAPATLPGDGESAANGDMGGEDFGVNDGGSWDDGSSGGGGGDDWT
jgi:uncharacterized protein